MTVCLMLGGALAGLGGAAGLAVSGPLACWIRPATDLGGAEGGATAAGAGLAAAGAGTGAVLVCGGAAAMEVAGAGVTGAGLGWAGRGAALSWASSSGGAGCS